MKTIRVDKNIQISEELYDELFKNMKFIMEHDKSKYLVYTKKYGKELFVQFPRKWLAEYFLYQRFRTEEFHYISSNGSECDKELKRFPDEEYDFKQFKYVKKKEK